jgi:trehalose 6-phosphate phosphatase
MPKPLPPLDRAALLLDLDGTLLEIAPKPDLVSVPPGLCQVLCDLRDRLGGALAIISGRPVAAVDALLPGVAFAVAGEHGAAFRFGPTEELERIPLPKAPAEWLTEAERLAARYPGAFVERKAAGFVVHYRLAPAAEGPMTEALARLVGAAADRFRLVPGRKALEVRPIGADKGHAVRLLMARGPFRGRQPIFIGDERTDEDGIAAAEALGGVGLFVPAVFGCPEAVRNWLARLLDLGNATPLPWPERMEACRPTDDLAGERAEP